MMNCESDLRRLRLRNQELRIRIDTQVDALKFYANENNYMDTSIEEMAEMARQALALNEEGGK